MTHSSLIDLHCLAAVRYCWCDNCVYILYHL